MAFSEIHVMILYTSISPRFKMIILKETLKGKNKVEKRKNRNI